MNKRRILFDDPEDLSKPSYINIEFMMDLQLLDYARRVFERKGDETSMKRAKEIRKFYKHTFENYYYIVRSIIPDETIRDQTRLVMASIEGMEKGKKE